MIELFKKFKTDTVITQNSSPSPIFNHIDFAKVKGFTAEGMFEFCQPNRGLIQNIFPFMSSDFREYLISGDILYFDSLVIGTKIVPIDKNVAINIVVSYDYVENLFSMFHWVIINIDNNHHHFLAMYFKFNYDVFDNTDLSETFKFKNSQYVNHNIIETKELNNFWFTTDFIDVFAEMLAGENIDEKIFERIKYRQQKLKFNRQELHDFIFDVFLATDKSIFEEDEHKVKKFITQYFDEKKK